MTIPNHEQNKSSKYTANTREPLIVIFRAVILPKIDKSSRNLHVIITDSPRTGRLLLKPAIIAYWKPVSSYLKARNWMSWSLWENYLFRAEKQKTVTIYTVIRTGIMAATQEERMRKFVHVLIFFSKCFWCPSSAVPKQVQQTDKTDKRLPDKCDSLMRCEYS